MSVNLLPSIIDERPSKLAQLSSLLNSFVSAMDTMRYNEFEQDVECIQRLYGVITGNGYMASLTSVGKLGRRRDEMYAFIRSQLIRFVDTVVDSIISQATINGEFIPMKDDTKGMFRPISEIHLAEFDILSKCEAMDGYHASYSKDQSLLATVKHDLQSILHGLIFKFKQIAASPDNRQINPRTYDYASVKTLVMIGHLIGHVARSIIISKTGFDNDYSEDKAEADKQTVYSEYTRFSNIGSMSIAGILCCFKREEVLPVAVINPNGSLREVEKGFLINILVLNKLT